MWLIYEAEARGQVARGVDGGVMAILEPPGFNASGSSGI